MSYELKKFAMDAVSGANSVIQGLGYAKAAAVTGIYVARIREADRERLNGGGTKVINNITIHNAVGSTQAVMNQNGLER